MLRRQLRWVLLANLGAALGCLLCEAVCLFGLHLSQPYTSPLLPGWGVDFRYWVPMMRHMHTAAFATTLAYPFLYPPAAAPFQYVFSVIPWKPALFFYCADLGVAVSAVLLFARALVRSGVRSRTAHAYSTLLALASFPLWFALRQGNIELLLFAFTAGGVWAYLRERHTAAAICFGVAGAAKLYPLVFLGLFLSRRQWRSLLSAAGTAAVLTLGSLWLIHPDLRVAVAETKRGLTVASNIQFLRQNPVQGGFDHSLLGAYKRVATLFPEPEGAKKLVRGYILSFGAVGLLAYGLRLRKLPAVNQVLGYSTAAVTFMPLSYDYTLLHMYLPFGMLALLLQRQPGVKASRPALLALALLVIVFAPLSEFIYHGTTVGGLFKTTALVGLFVLSLSSSLAPKPQVAAPSAAVADER